MKMVLDRKAFLNKLSLVGKNSSRGEKTQSGIHSYIYLKLKKGKLGIRCWNGMSMLMTVMSDGVIEMEGEGAMLLPVDKLQHVVSTSTTKKVTIEEDKETRYMLKANGRSNVNGMPLSEFPEAVINGTPVVETTLEKFCKRSSRVVGCVADSSYSQQVLTGVFWNGDFVATDTHRASIYRGEKIKKEFVIPVNVVGLLNDIYREIGDTTLKVLSVEDRVLIFKFGGCIVSCPVIVGKFPNYQTILDKTKDSKHSIEFSRDEMVQILQRSSIFEDRNKAILLRIKEGKLQVQIGHEEAHKEYVKSAKVKPDQDEEIYMNLNTFQDCMNTAPQNEIVMQYSSKSQPVFVSQKNWTYFMMPIMRGV